MFWGLIMEPRKRYSQKVKKAFHISMASMDATTSSEEPAQVMCTFEGRNYLLCTLRKPDLLQCPLDLNFEKDIEVSFATNGKCYVHLTGYLHEELDDLEDMDESEEEEEEEATFEEEEIKSKKTKKNQKENGPPKKKAKLVEEVEEEEEDDDDDELDGDSDDEGEAEEEEDGEEEEDDEEEQSEDEASSLSEEESENEAEIVQQQNKKAKKVNGVDAKKQKESPKTKKNDKEAPKNEKPTPKKRVLEKGVMVEDIREGTGMPAKNGKLVAVYYEGRLKQNNKMFDSTTSGPGFKFHLGAHEVIKGWDIGLAGMKVGGKRRITCPPNAAYGPKGSPPAIPPNSTLVFEVELKKVFN